MSNVADRLIAKCRSWDDFVEQASSIEPTKARGDVFERLTQLYLQTEPEYVSKLRFVWLLGDVPPRVRDHLNLPKPDEGIDLIAKTHDGVYWAIQSKYRADKTSTLTREDLSNFSGLAFVHCENIAFGLVAHTSMKAIRKRELLGNIGEIGFDVWFGLTDEHWEQIHRKLDRKPVKLERRPPRPHQEAAIKAARQHFITGNASRGRILMPCGTGKSLTAFWVAQELGAKHILVAVPSLALIGQSLRDWTREFLAAGQVPEWLCVCSSEDVGKLEKDEFVGQTYDLGVPTTTKADEIAAFLGGGSRKPRIVFTTYQSGRRLAEASEMANFRFDVAILDEAHKTVGPKAKAFAVLLDDNNLRVKHRVFMTATERVLKSRSDEVLSMDDAEVYGARFYELSFKQAIEDELICDYRILTVTVSDQRIRELLQDRRFVDADERLEEVDAQELAAGLALKCAVKDRGIKHAISFHRSIRSAKDFAVQQDVLDEDRSLGPRMVNLHISSKKSVGERSSLLKEFPTHSRSLLTNARCLTEGVDIPEVDCVLFANPKQSVVDIVQAAGRAMRRHDEKDVGYILLPLVVPEGMGLEEFAETTPFRQVARTITALSTQDERIAEEFRAVDRRPVPSDRLVQFDGDMPVGMAIDLRDFAEQISTRLWERVGRANWRPFHEARDYIHEVGVTGTKHWRKLAEEGRLPPDIPVAPNTVYSKEWKTWGDWFGTGSIAPQFRQFRDFEVAREYAHTLGLKNKKQWDEWGAKGNRPSDIPANPDRDYEAFVSWGDWLDTGVIGKTEHQYVPFAQARQFAHSLRLGRIEDWWSFASSVDRPNNVPYHPERAYKDLGWVSFADFLGYEPPFRRKPWNIPLRGFHEARKYARSLGLASVREWLDWCATEERPLDIPVNPAASYRGKGWAGYRDFLGYEMGEA